MEQRFQIHKGVSEHLAMIIYWKILWAFEDTEKWEWFHFVEEILSVPLGHK